MCPIRLDFMKIVGDFVKNLTELKSLLNDDYKYLTIEMRVPSSTCSNFTSSISVCINFKPQPRRPSSGFIS